MKRGAAPAQVPVSAALPRAEASSAPTRVFRAGTQGALGLPFFLPALLLPALLLSALLTACGEPPREPNGRPVVLVVVDTLRADALQLHGESLPTSPELLRRAGNAAVFDRAFAPSPWTLPSFGSLLTGRYPQLHGAGASKVPSEDGGKKRFAGLAPSVPALAEVLAGEGYATAAFITNTFLHPKFGLDRGFSTYDQTTNRFLDDRRAGMLVDRSLEWIDAQGGRPFFLMLQLLDPHLPYDPPPPWQGAFTAGYAGPLRLPFGPRFKQLAALRSGRWELTDADRAFIAGAYAEQVPAVDEAVGRLLAGLGSRGLLGEALVVFTADHGEELFDHGSFEHGHTMFQELLHVPLVVWGPGVEAGRLAAPVSLVDLAPTVLEAVGLPEPAPMDGVSLWPLLTRGAALPERTLFAQAPLYGPPREAAVAWPWKLIYMGGDRQTLLYDLAADPGETRDLAAERPAELHRLLAALHDFLAVGEASTAEASDVELDEKIEEDLRALGYVE